MYTTYALPLLLAFARLPTSTIADVMACTCQDRSQDPPQLPPNQAMGVNVFQGGQSGSPCEQGLFMQWVFNKYEVFGLNHCFKTPGPATCVARRLTANHIGQIGSADADGWDRGFDASPYSCTVTGFSDTACQGQGTQAVYNNSLSAWSFAGVNTGLVGLDGVSGAVTSFQMSCTNTFDPPPQGPPQPGSWNIPFTPMPSDNPPTAATLGISPFGNDALSSAIINGGNPGISAGQARTDLTYPNQDGTVTGQTISQTLEGDSLPGSGLGNLRMRRARRSLS